MASSGVGSRRETLQGAPQGSQTLFHVKQGDLPITEVDPTDHPREPSFIMSSFELFTDGACSGNPGPGGWAFVLRGPGIAGDMEVSGGDPETTNNRMELLAVIRGLEALPGPSAVRVVSDSEYVVKGLREWLDGWKARGWRTAAKKPVKNDDLWRQLDALRATHRLSPEWIRGHNEHPENTRCDALAVAAIERMRRGRG